MRKYKKIMAILYVVIFALFCVLGLTRNVKRESRADMDILTETRVFDDAGLFSSDEEQKLDKKMKQVMKSEKMDLAIVTTNSTDGKTAQEYAENFYRTHGFGYEKEMGTGAILLVDMQNRKIWISGSGEAKKYLNNKVSDKIYKEIKKDCTGGKYYSASLTFLSKAKSYMNQSTSIPPFLRNAGWRLLMAVVVTAVFVFIKVKTFGMKVTTTASTYLKSGSARTNSRRDDFLGTTVTTRIIEHNNDNGGGFDGGGDSGGSDFSGGGGDF